MALINLKTNLKSLKFGNDQFDGGSSNQPYIQTPIPENTGEYGFLDSDFILRGGSKAVTDSLIDVKRLGKYFIDTKNPSGILFIAKQNLLSRIAVKTQASGLLNEGVYTPISTLVQAGGNAFGLHVNKQGLNPFNGIGSLRTYADVVNPELGEAFSIKSIDKNRLILLAGSKITNTLSANPLTTNISLNPINILTYGGGPDSIIGIGSTNIRFADQRTGLNNPELKNSGFFATSPDDKNNYGVFSAGKTSNAITTINGNKLLGASDSYFVDFPNIESPIDNGFNFPEGQQTSEKPYGPQDNNKTLSTNPLPSVLNSNGAYTYTQKDLIEIQDVVTTQENQVLSGRSGITTPGDFRQKLRINNNQEATQNIGNLSNAPNYTEKNIEQRVNLGDPGNRNGKNLTSYTLGSISGSASEGSYDKINASPIYQSAGPQGTNNPDPNALNNDLVKFRIGVYDLHTDGLLKNYIHFRAFLNQISDAYTSEWNDTRYIGRGEKFYTYGGFDRKVSLSWTVAAQSKVELIPMYKKLNYLASICAPDYSANGYMRGNIVTLTVGGYLYEQPGIITGLSYEMNDDNATWEIGIDTEGGNDNSVKELPHLIKVTGFNFIPIHDFVPRLQQNSYGRFDTEKPYIDSNSYGSERFIALSAGGESNYGETYIPE
jgi:hypothetical protein